MQEPKNSLNHINNVVVQTLVKSLNNWTCSTLCKHLSGKYSLQANINQDDFKVVFVLLSFTGFTKMDPQVCLLSEMVLLLAQLTLTEAQSDERGA